MSHSDIKLVILKYNWTGYYHGILSCEKDMREYMYIQALKQFYK